MTSKPGPISRRIAAQLRARMAEGLLTQSAVASKADISQSQLSKILRGERTLDVDLLHALCILLSLDISEVVDKAHEDAIDLPNYFDLYRKYRPLLDDDGEPIVEASVAVPASPEPKKGRDNIPTPARLSDTEAYALAEKIAAHPDRYDLAASTSRDPDPYEGLGEESQIPPYWDED